jgi:hypothetical protein
VQFIQWNQQKNSKKLFVLNDKTMLLCARRKKSILGSGENPRLCVCGTMVAVAVHFSTFGRKLSEPGMVLNAKGSNRLADHTETRTVQNTYKQNG